MQHWVLFPLSIFFIFTFSFSGLLAQEMAVPLRKAPSPFSDALLDTQEKKEQFRKKSFRGQRGDMKGDSEIKAGEIEEIRKEIKELKENQLEQLNAKTRDDCPPTTLEGYSPTEADSDEPFLSPFEAYVRGEMDSFALRDIDQFGYNLFRLPAYRPQPINCRRPLSRFAPAETTPVGPDYLLGPGDELKITLWGKLNMDYAPIIDAEGKIVFPEIGVLHLAGLTFAETKGYLEKELSRYYRASEVQINISMGRLRSIRIFVIGKVQRPGSYTLSSRSSLINAVLSSGGPTKSGTLRDIQVKRNGETIVHFDLYDFLLKGDKTNDVRLMPEDVIFVPSVGPLVGIVGHVKNPAIYEMKDDLRLLDLIDMAGGLTATAFKGRVQVQRIQDHQLISFFEGNLVDVTKEGEKNLLLQDGDIVRIFPVIEERRTVILSGAVGSPGEFGITPGVTRVKDLINQAGGLLYYAFAEGNITRVKVTQEGPKTEYIPIHLKKALKGDPSHNILLEMNDYIFVRSIPEWQLYRKVQLNGEVQFPGEYTIKQGEAISSVIRRAGGFTEKAYLKGAVLTRESVKALQRRHLDETIARLEQRLLSHVAGDLDTVISNESALLEKGALEQRQLLLARLKAIQPLGRLPIELGPLDAFEGSFSDIPLEEGDTLVVPERPSSVQVLGSVYNQGSYLYSQKMELWDYITKSGGIGKDADEDEMYILKVDGTAVSRRLTDRFFFSSTFANLELDPGDTIVVPEKIDRIPWLREFKDIVQILYQMAVTAAVVINIR